MRYVEKLLNNFVLVKYLPLRIKEKVIPAENAMTGQPWYPGVKIFRVLAVPGEITERRRRNRVIRYKPEVQPGDVILAEAPAEAEWSWDLSYCFLPYRAILGVVCRTNE